ncbi:MAG TPA: hypothetical protein VFZ98_04230, partial [Vicinamibacterales bacterium]
MVRRRLWWRAAVVAAALFSTAIAADAAQSFVYVAAPICQSGVPCAPEVLVYDASTTALVTTIGLPLNTSPAGIVISHDGTRLYVSLRASSTGTPSLAVVDLTANVFLTQYASNAAGPLAISRDGTRVFTSSQYSIDVFDVAGQRSIGTLQSGVVLDLAGSPSADSLYTTSFQ